MAAAIYDHEPRWPRTPCDDATDAAHRLLGLARTGIAASDTVLSIDLMKMGYTQLFEVMAVIADGLLENIEAVERAAGLGFHTPQPPAQDADSAAEIYNQWKAHNAAWRAFASALDATAELPELDAMAGTVEALAQQIAGCTPRTDADAAAMLQWVIEDCDGALLSPEYAKAQKAVADYLTGKR